MLRHNDSVVDTIAVEVVIEKAQCVFADFFEGFARLERRRGQRLSLLMEQALSRKTAGEGLKKDLKSWKTF